MKSDAILTKKPGGAWMRAPMPSILPVTFRPIPTAFLIVYALLLALALGLGSAYLALRDDPPFGGVRLGPWIAWLKLGSPEADPYMRAITAKRSDVPLAAGEGLTFRAEVDSEGRRLNSACSYRIGSSAPAARLWTLTLYDQSERLPVTQLGRRGFTSAEILRDAEDGFTILLSREFQPGNWLQLPSSGAFSLILRLYDPPGIAGSIVEESNFPAIQRLGCGA